MDSNFSKQDSGLNLLPNHKLPAFTFEEECQEADERIQKAVECVRRSSVPEWTEPAFLFQATL